MSQMLRFHISLTPELSRCQGLDSFVEQSMQLSLMQDLSQPVSRFEHRLAELPWAVRGVYSSFVPRLCQHLKAHVLMQSHRADRFNLRLQ